MPSAPNTILQLWSDSYQHIDYVDGFRMLYSNICPVLQSFIKPLALHFPNCNVSNNYKTMRFKTLMVPFVQVYILIELKYFLKYLPYISYYMSDNYALHFCANNKLQLNVFFVGSWMIKSIDFNQAVLTGAYRFGQIFPWLSYWLL